MAHQDFYGTTLEALMEAKNDRLWFKTQLKLCGLWFKLKEYGRASKILRDLHKCVWCSFVLIAFMDAKWKKKQSKTASLMPESHTSAVLTATESAAHWSAGHARQRMAQMT